MSLLSSLRRRTSDNEAKVQEFIVWVSTATDVEEQGSTVTAHQQTSISVWVSLPFYVIDTVIRQITFLSE